MLPSFAFSAKTYLGPVEVLTYIVSYYTIPTLGGDTTLWWKLSTVITCGTLAGAIIPEFVKVFTSVDSRHTREVVTSSREGGPSLNILSGLVAGNFSAFWLGMTIMVLMAIAYIVSTFGLGALAQTTVVDPAALHVTAVEGADVGARLLACREVEPADGADVPRR